MIDFIEYVVSELKSKRLSKTIALSLIRQFSGHSGASVQATVMHPLVHRNTSDLTQQSYRSTFDGQEFFLRDHRVQGRKVLPGVAYLEMARAAIDHALPERPEGSVLQLRNIVWAQPIVVDEPREIALAVFVEEESRSSECVGFEIYSPQENELIHCQGQAVFSSQPAPPKRDLSELRERTAQNRLEPSVLYPAMLEAGIEIGPAQQGVRAIHWGEQQLLIEIALPAVVDNTRTEYVLHPSVMDSAVQAAMALVVDPVARTSGPPLPFALESLRVFSACQKEMVAWVRYSAGSRRDDRVIKLDIDLCDSEGNVCVQMLGFSSRVLSGEIEASASAAGVSAELGTLIAAPTWEQCNPTAVPGVDAKGFAERHLVLCNLATVDGGELEKALALSGQCIHVRASSDNDLASHYSTTALACFEKVQAILQSQPRGPVLVQIVAPSDSESLLLAGISGLLKTAARENPRLVGQIMFTEPDIDAGQLAQQLRQETRGAPESIVKYAHGERHVLRWKELEQSLAEVVYRDNGVYLITGGLGGLGVLFAKEILRTTKSARVVLTGRSVLSPDKQAIIDGLGGGNRVLYRQLNLSDAAQVNQVIAVLVAELGQLNGIIHSAGMARDNFILKKTAAEFCEVMAPKVTGTLNIDTATAEVDLDFLVLFSSVSAVYGNAGQADYTTANGFMDAFAGLRNQWVSAKQRRGATVSINWPLWQEGGMRLDATNQQMTQRLTGMHPMQTSTGMRAVCCGIAAQRSQVLVVEGDLEQLRRALLMQQQTIQEQVHPTQQEEVRPAAAPVDSTSLLDKTQDYLRKQFSVVLKLAPHRIDPQAPLEKYGIDSILAMELTSQLELTFGSLPKTLFFEYQTISELASYLVRDYSPALSGLFTARGQRDMRKHAARPRAEASVEIPSAAKSRAPSNGNARSRRRRRHLGGTGHTANAEPIAIVGLSGRYPESPDLDAYWQNLRDGKDCIVEIPKGRWDWRDYYTEDRAAEGAHFSKWGGFICGVDEFDPLFFNIPPVDVELIDPQERLFLQHVWMAMEDAGCTRATLQAPHDRDLAGQVGVYVGVMYGEHQLFGAEASVRGRRMGIPVSYASIANRVSYLLNLHGPSLALDTMCSSSLTAIHLACQDLKQGRTSLAIAGGVNVSIHPNKYLILSSGQYISSEGHCQSFGAGGDGYIPGEGVGVVILKRLSDAQRDGNHIYGLIRGSALNHGGKTNGYTVPNLPAQASVIGRALRECNVDARHISYIEAHGTGTKLGDPIEIAALTHAFRQYTQENQFCLVGSAKSNFGHCESAAGIAGLTKVLLQLKHQQVVPSLHSATLNPHIDFEKSPFRVNQTLCSWEPPEVNGRRVPRIAGISSFGAGGSNAHLIVEEYPTSTTEPGEPHGQLVFPLSARTEEQLKQKTRDLAVYMRGRTVAAESTRERIDLSSVAYTLQVGREAMDVRVGFVATSVTDLVAKLEAYSNGEIGSEELFQGRVASDSEGIAVLGQDEDMAAALDKWIARGKFSRLLELWVKGLEVDWRKLHDERKPLLCSLPTYPFAKERYWIAPVTPGATGSASGPAAAALHPLLHINTSDLQQQSYAVTFSGDEVFLTDHQIEAPGGKLKVLPAVAYLEMVRAAIDLALPTSEPRSLEIQNTAWAQPLVVNGKCPVAVSLLANDVDCIDFEIAGGEAPEGPSIHCTGRVTLALETPPTRLDIDALKERMTRGSLQPDEVYDAYQAIGIHYGPAFRCLTLIHRGQGELLAELSPHDAAARMDGCMLHPGVMDSALQASIGLLESLEMLPRQPPVPFALDCLRIFSPCASRMFAWVRSTPGRQPGGDVSKLDIDLCDQDGNVCAQLLGLAARKLGEPQKTMGSLLARPLWQTIPIDVADPERLPKFTRHVLVLCNLPHLNTGQLATLVPGIEFRLLHLPTTAGGIAERYCDAAAACFAELRALLQGNSTAGPVLFQVVVGQVGEDVMLAGLSGLIRTARLENPNVMGQLVLTGAAVDEQALAAQLLAAKLRSDEALLKYENDGQSVLRWEAEPLQATQPLAFRKQGVYLITGGLGGLGALFAKEIVTRAEGARVILTGRSELTAEKWSAITKLAAEACVPSEQLVYRQLDLSRGEAVEQLVTDIVEDFGGIQGVIHSAGMIRDRFLINKTQDEFVEVLAPKVVGAFNLDQATRDLDLDFLVLFSSVSGAFGNAGQADYATANGFLDQFASYRNELVKWGSRRGQTLSINWPLWEEGGMQLNAQTQELLAKVAGIVPMKTQTGMDAFQRSLELQAGQTLILEGDVQRLHQLLNSRPVTPALERGAAAREVPATALERRAAVSGRQTASADRQRPAAGHRTLVAERQTPAAEREAVAPEAQTAASTQASELLARTQQLLCQQLATLMKLPAYELDPKAPLEKYGIDSVLAMKLTSRLEQSFGSLSKTLFFEHQTLASLAGYLVKAFPDTVRRMTGLQTTNGPSADGRAARGRMASSGLPIGSGVPAGGGVSAGIGQLARGGVPSPRGSGADWTTPSTRSLAARAQSRFLRPGKPGTPERDVAIIGVSGRYPLAANLEEFWQNLKDGRDCITEIPRDRWDYRRFYHPERNQANRSYCKWGGFIAAVDQFDPLFFNISPREAELIDPQERLFLETVWETIEDAGYSKEAIARNRVGVYVGAMWGQYELFGANANRSGIPSSSFSSIANRISYFFNFQGPSLALDTMCSSSLTAIHLASEEIRKGNVDVAIAGGVNVSIHPNKYLNLSQGNFASTDGRCRSFGEGGDGYVPGEGVGAVLLKSLEQALADGDHVYAVVKASSINHGGKTNGYTVPNPQAQSNVILETLEKAQIDPATLSYIETHGTGTSLGDPIEITGLVQAFGGATATHRPEAGANDASGPNRCPIGSVKSNIGHLESAAGIAAVTKVLLQLRHRQLVPSLHAEPLNPNINFAATPFCVQTKLEDWLPAQGHPRRAGVSSFGAGGSNAHLILEELIDPRVPTASSSQGLESESEYPEAFVLSARSREGLMAYGERMLAFLERAQNPTLKEIAYTSQVGRTAMQERLVVIASSCSTLHEKLDQWLRTTKTRPREKVRAATQPVEDVYEGSLKDSRSTAAALLEGEAGAAFMQLTVEKRDLSKLAQLWIAGVEIDWAALHGVHRPRKVSLPTYPFSRQRYWVELDSTADPTASAAGPTALEADKSSREEPHELLHYRPEWRAMELNDGSQAQSAAPLLILDTDASLFRCFKTDEGAAGGNRCQVILVKPAEAFQQTESDVFTVGPESEADFLQLAAALQARGSLPRAVIHHDAGGLEQGIFALHNLCKALIKQKPREGVRIVSVQRRLSDERSAMHAALGGFFKTLTLENPKFLAKVIEAPPSATTGDLATLARAELNEAAWQSNEIRYLHAQQGGRQVRVFERHDASAQPATGAALKQGGVYLITGGLGGLGYLFSEHLAKHYQARLVLTGRSAPTAEQLHKLAQLTAYGHEPIYRQVDVTDRAQVEALVREVKVQYSRLDGVIHSAGVHRDAFILNKSLEDVRSVLAAKVLGTINLDQAARDEQLDLFILFSSVAGALGNPGQSDYAFANNFMDAFAEQRHASRSGRTLSINWPFWEEGGMKLSRSQVELTERERGITPLPTDKGIQCFETLLQSACSQAIVIHGIGSKVGGYVLRQSGSEGRAVTENRVTDDSAAESRAIGDATENSELADTSALTAKAVSYLQALLSAETKLPAEQVDPEERFDSFGIDSMMISRMNAVLERDLGDLPKTLFYEYTTVEELAAYLVQEAQPALAKQFAPPRTAAARTAAVKPTAAVESTTASGSTAAGRPAATAPGAASTSTVSIACATTTAAVPSSPGSAPVTEADEPIAIIGIHGSFPHSETLAQYWENLKAGKDLIDPVPPTRWDSRELFDPDPEAAKDGKIYCTTGGFLENFDKFDAEFFQISPEDARLMDPQERLFLQSTWAAIEDAGYTRESLKKAYPKGTSADVGVFAGVTTNTYHLLTPEEWSRGNRVTPGALPWSIANRVSYFFDFQGPSMPVDTACSSSLVAMHLACESLRRRECQLAIAGGVNLYLHVSKYQSFCRRRMLAANGRCRSFGAGDDGFIPGEGVGTVVLKPLRKAVEHRDHIYGLIVASACEHGGRSHGYSAPNPRSQAELIAHTLRKANVNPETIGYVEGHGTGTQLGDNLEIVSLTQAFERSTQQKQFCSIGSVKANIGHSESAASIAGVAKLLLQLKHRQIAPTIHSDVVNPNIDFESSPFYLQRELAPWKPVGAEPRRALINAFGAGGVNACAILEEYKGRAEEPSTSKGPHLIVLSARNAAALREAAHRLGSFLSSEPGADMARLAYTLQVGREAMAERLAIVARDAAELLKELENFSADNASEAIAQARVENRRQSRKARKQNERDAANSLFVKGELNKMAQMWVHGEDLEWQDFYADQRPTRLPLPTYPFAKERYWVSDAPAAEKHGTRPALPIAPPQHQLMSQAPLQLSLASPPQLHPLVTANVSTLKEIAFASTLTTEPYYARDHQVNGEMFFPGAGFLEIACVNATIAAEQKVTSIRDIVWSAPLRLEAPGSLLKTFLKTNDDATEYATVSFDEDNERIVHSEGRVLYTAAAEGDGYSAEPEPVQAIQSLKARCSRTLDGTQCYRKFARHGLQYGSSFQTIQELHIGAGFALSKLELRDALQADFEQYILHPCLIDGALQTVIGLAVDNESDSPYLPFALDEVQILRPLPPSCYAYVELADTSNRNRPDIRKFNIRLLNENGDVLLKLNNFYVRALRARRALETLSA